MEQLNMFFLTFGIYAIICISSIITNNGIPWRQFFASVVIGAGFYLMQIGLLSSHGGKPILFYAFLGFFTGFIFSSGISKEIESSIKLLSLAFALVFFIGWIGSFFITIVPK